jgi:penicillin-binding protein 1B
MTQTAKAKNPPRNFLAKFFFFCLIVLIIGILIFASYLFYLDRTVKHSLKGRLWAIPARIYAQPLELFEGRYLSAKHFEKGLIQLGYQPGALSRPGTYQIPASGVVRLYSRGFNFADGAEKSRRIQVQFSGQRLVRLLDLKTKKPIDSIRLEPQEIGVIHPAHQEDRILVKLEEVPKHLIASLLATEDRNFFSHRGFSVRGILRAIWTNTKGTELAQGGSTITQQLVKNLYLTRERTLSRKFREICIALLLERRHSKQEILQAYLNEVYLGQSGSRAIHGFGLASQHYFGVPISELQPHQSAMLVGMIKGPSLYNPHKRPKLVLTRRNLVLELLAQTGNLTERELISEIEQPLELSQASLQSSERYPAFFDLIRRQLKTLYREEDLQNQGLKIFTTLDPILQVAAEEAVSQTLNKLDKGVKKSVKLQGALIISQPDTGEILALVSDRNPRFPGFNRALDAQRQVGSIIKPAVYLAALEQAENYQLNTFLSDRSFTVRDANQRPWSPSNYNKKEHGDVLLQEALANSYNLATAKLALDVGLRKVVNVLHDLGVEQDLQPLPSLSLGAIDLTPYQVASMYQTIAANGFKSPLRALRYVTDANGKPLSSYSIKVSQVFSAPAIYKLQHALQAVVSDGTGKEAERVLGRRLGLAGKTGTTNKGRDTWFAGMSGNYLGVAWVGRDDNSQTRWTGATGALKVWIEFMKRSSPTAFDPIPALGVTKLYVNKYTGARSSARCANTIEIVVDEDKIPQAIDPNCEPALSDDSFFDWLSQDGQNQPAEENPEAAQEQATEENPEVTPQSATEAKPQAEPAVQLDDPGFFIAD